MSAQSQLNTRVKVFYLKYVCCYVVLDSLDWLSQKQLLLVADVFSQHLVNLARNSFLVTRKRVNIFTPPYVTSSCYPRIRDPDEFCTHSVSHSSSPVLTPFPEMLLRRLPLPCLFFFLRRY